jgi:hypothetical protein
MKRGRKRTICHEKVLEYAKKHPELLEIEIGQVLGISQRSVSRILRQAGIDRSVPRGRSPVPKNNETDEQFYWEKRLHDLGLGMDRGLRINCQRILYGYDPLKEKKAA